MYDQLRKPLHDPVTPWARLEIVDRLWLKLSPGPPRGHELNWDAFFAYYERECRSALLEEGKHCGARTHEELLRYTRLLSMEPNQEEIRHKIQEDFRQPRTPEDIEKMVQGSIRISARILAMVNVGTLRYEISRQQSISWKNDQSLSEAVHGHFQVCNGPLTNNISFGPYFTACRDIRVARIGIQWTDNLVDHLRLVQGAKKVCVFHHVSFLKRMEHIQSSMFPKNFVQETLETLTLLFPSKDRKTARWLQNECRGDLKASEIKVDVGLLSVGHFKASHRSRNLEHFQYWRDRLELLNEAVDGALNEATSRREQALRTLRNHKQGDSWITSWAAIVAIGLTLFFGLVQSIEGAIQVWKAYHPTTV